jgi:2-phospho-L-lactate guanylyltransferase (CobY/MobA/RfbA family)
MGLAYFCLFHDALGRLRCSFFFESFRRHIEEATKGKTP